MEYTMEDGKPQNKEEVALHESTEQKGTKLLVGKNTEAEDDGSYYLSGKPFVDVVLPRTSVFPNYQQHMPASMSKLLPQKTVPVVLTHGGKHWNMLYMGADSRPRLDTKWKFFAKDNNLKLGDACVLELMENSETNIRFNVQILRRDLPPELKEMLVSHGVSLEMLGESPETPICLD